MNSMKSFYASISSPSLGRDPYLEALSEITRINLKQASSLRSELGWQEWGEHQQGAVA